MTKKPSQNEKTPASVPVSYDAREEIINVREQRVIVDVDLAKLYGTVTKRLN